MKQYNSIILSMGMRIQAAAGPGQERGDYMEAMKKLPIGVEFFRDFKSENFYYVDKTGMISRFLRTRGVVNLFTRPRRFGKSLNMNMFKTFFETGTDADLFEGLQIARETQLCEKYM